MTTIALNYSKSLLEGLFGSVKKTIQGVMIGMMIARQTQANQEVARQVSKYEYNGKNYWQILHQLNAATISSIEKEFKQ
jgi:hypothetical protein